MRFIIHELPYEQPILAGRLRYERDGSPTGAVESWRLTAAMDGFRFLRVDVDAREAPSGQSSLYHLTLNPIGRPEQLKYRFWGNGLEVSGAAVWNGNEVIAARRVNEVAYEDVVRGSAFWFPAGAGLALLAECVGETQGITMVTSIDDRERLMALVETPVAIELGASTVEQVDDDLLAVRSLVVRWGEHTRTIQLDSEHRPLRLWRDDGLTATYERLVRYG